MTASSLGTHAVVIGAGMGGLVATAAIAKHFESVTILDRDTLPAGPEHRAGTPQARHLHALLAGGLRALDELFPGFEDELVRVGAVPLRAGMDIRSERPGFDPFPARDLHIRMYAMSRPLLEFAVRERVRELPNAAIHPLSRVVEIVPSRDGSSATGVRFSKGSERVEFVPADLVIDSSGRGIPTLQLLAETGRRPPEETQIGVDIGYTTVRYRIPRSQTRDWKAVMHLASAPSSSRGSLLYPMEGDHWILATGGRGAEKPPSDEAGLLDWVRQLRTPTIHDAIKGAERVGEILRYGFQQSVRRHFAQLQSFPAGVLPVADAICVFNPIYGQGMTVAAQEAVLLRRLLQSASSWQDCRTTLARAFFGEVESLLETPWIMSAIPDLAYPSTTGDRPSDLMQTIRFGAAVIRLAARDPEVHKLMVEVGNLIKPRSAYREPEFMKRVIIEMAQG